MKIKYVGPKPQISSHGVNFDLNKEDKFIYLSVAVELIKALDHEYVGDKRYTHLAANKPLDIETITDVIRKHAPDLDSYIAKYQEVTKEEIEAELKSANENIVLNDDEKIVLVKNINMLRNYRLERAKNKSIYYSAINAIADIIHNGNIDYIHAPMFPKFAHVFHSLQGALIKKRPPIDSKIDIYEEDGELKIRIDILHRA